MTRLINRWLALLSAVAIVSGFVGILAHALLHNTPMSNLGFAVAIVSMFLAFMIAFFALYTGQGGGQD